MADEKPVTAESGSLTGKDPAEGNAGLEKAFNSAIKEAKKTLELTTMGGIFLHSYKQRVG
jgi:predicted secreted protein